jgi:hypothetical protein
MLDIFHGKDIEEGGKQERGGVQVTREVIRCYRCRCTCFPTCLLHPSSYRSASGISSWS